MVDARDAANEAPTAVTPCFDLTAPSGARWMLRVLGPGGSTHPLPTGQEIVIGRGEQADIVIDHPSISRRHAALKLGAPSTIRDLGSANGTRVGGLPVREGDAAPLAPGEVLELGSVSMAVHSGLGARTPRRVWAHGYFEGRVEDECARAIDEDVPFAIIHVRCDRRSDEAVVLEGIASALQPTSVVGSFAPGEYEVLLPGSSSDEAARFVARVAAEAKARGLALRCGLASFPRDGRTADALMACARAAVRPPRPSQGPGSAPEAIVRDEAMVRLHAMIRRVAVGNISVLLLGETGVGKEVAAEAVHHHSKRASRPYVRINCGAISETLLESELFGYEKGAFTGAQQAKPGLLEIADGGTVFLDEVGELPPPLQVKLLRVLENRELLRVGAVTPRPTDLRFVAATNRDLEADMSVGRFRRDLFYRLGGASLVIPPLRERRSEIEPLARAFLAQAAEGVGVRAPALSPEALEQLAAYGWPGNIRELRNMMERAVLLCDGSAVTPEHLPLEKMVPTVAPGGAPREAPPAARDELAASFPSPEQARALSLPEYLEAVELARITEVLEACSGNQTRAAKALGISRTALVSRLEKYGVARPRKGT